MYGIFTYIYHNFMINVGKYSLHGASGYIYIYTSASHPSATPIFFGSEAYSPNFQMRSEVLEGGAAPGGFRKAPLKSSFDLYSI